MTKRPHEAAVLMIAGLFCRARREGDGSDEGCPCRITPNSPEPICPRCREDAEAAIKVASEIA